MPGTIGNIASLAGVVRSLLGLGFAVLQLLKLRGETRAARKASESAERAIRRDSAMTDLALLYEKMQALKAICRSGDKTSALFWHRDILAGLLNVQRHHPRLTEGHLERILAALADIGNMERRVGRLSGSLSPEMTGGGGCNDTLLDIQSKPIPGLQDGIPGPS